MMRKSNIISATFKYFYRGMSSKTSNRPFTVIVEGNIGSGKTTFINHFQRYDDVATFAEPVDKWRDVNGHNLLELLYSDTKKTAMTFQSYVQLTMVDIHTRRCPQPIKVMERSLFSARHCFVENLHQNGFLDGPEYAVLDEWFKWLCKKVDVEVDMIVYLRTSPEVALDRIKKRGRNEEREVPLSYLEQLHALHEKWLCEEKNNITAIPVLVIDGDKMLSDMEDEIKRCAQLILDSKNQYTADVLMHSNVPA
ncbi:deoxynucleoside kinase-like [Ischnura elegans]|uniref:deoxynucleoside kinase-like n=1 Tax=Ischnura elegans TaxID=197161 RepID=UPI001ED86843|nr:deoxynucleoside kinase-like [Ischnura elegans]